MKKLLLIFSICSLAVTAAFSQDDVYYSGDEASVEVKAQIAPPALPVYVQPPCPYDGYMWTPGYWAWAPAGYYWVPGVWVAPPRPGLLWTPGYWGFFGGYYGWHRGYWGEHVGFYGGVCYGYGYGGAGFYGGRWEGGAFRYNTAVWQVNTTVIHNTYVSREGVQSAASNGPSFNGQGGVQAHPIASEQQAMHENHVAATSIQQSHQQAASNDTRQFASANHGKPATAAMNAPNGQAFNPKGHATSSAGMASHPSNGFNSTNHATPAAHSTNNNRPAPANPGDRSQPITHTNTGSQPSHYNSSQQPHFNSTQPSHNSNPGHSQAPRTAAPRSYSRPAGGGNSGGGKKR